MAFFLRLRFTAQRVCAVGELLPREGPKHVSTCNRVCLFTTLLTPPLSLAPDSHTTATACALGTSSPRMPQNITQQGKGICLCLPVISLEQGRKGWCVYNSPPGTIGSGTGRKHTSDIYTSFSFFQYHRAANRSTPIVAVAPPRLFQASPPPLAQKYFNENLQFPVPARKVRGLATRWLLPPPSCSGAAAPSGMVGELDPGLTAWAAAAGHAAGGGGCISGGSTITPTSVPSSLPGGGFPSQQQQQGGGGVPSNAPSCGSSAAAAGGGALLASGRYPQQRRRGNVCLLLGFRNNCRGVPVPPTKRRAYNVNSRTGACTTQAPNYSMAGCQESLGAFPRNEPQGSSRPRPLLPRGSSTHTHSRLARLKLLLRVLGRPVPYVYRYVGREEVVSPPPATADIDHHQTDLQHDIHNTC